MKISLVIPCFNESANLPVLVDRIKTSVTSPDVEVILVDNGSTDNSSEVMGSLVADSLNLKVTRVEQNQGYGFGILAGLETAEGEYLAWTHADMQTDPKDILRAMELIRESDEADVFIKGKRYGRPFADVFFTIGMTIFESILLGKWLYDINAQPTVVPRSLYQEWDSPPHDFSLDLFAYYSAKRKGIPIKRFPVFFGERAFGVSHWNIDLKSKIRFIKRTINYSIELKRKL